MDCSSSTLWPVVGLFLCDTAKWSNFSSGKSLNYQEFITMLKQMGAFLKCCLRVYCQRIQSSYIANRSQRIFCLVKLWWPRTLCDWSVDPSQVYIYWWLILVYVVWCSGRLRNAEGQPKWVLVFGLVTFVSWNEMSWDMTFYVLYYTHTIIYYEWATNKLLELITLVV